MVWPVQVLKVRHLHNALYEIATIKRYTLIAPVRYGRCFALFSLWDDPNYGFL